MNDNTTPSINTVTNTNNLGSSASSASGSDVIPTVLPSLSPIFAVGYINGAIMLHGLDIQSSTNVQIQSSPLRIIPNAHSAPITSLHANAHVDILVSASLDGTIAVWSLTTGALKLRIHPTPSNEGIGWITYSSLHQTIIAYFPCSNSVMQFSIFSGHAVCKQAISLSMYNLSSVYCYCLSEDGSSLFLGGAGPYILIFNLSILQLSGKIGLNGAHIYEAICVYRKITKEIMQMKQEEYQNDKRKDKEIHLEPFTSAITSIKLTNHEHSIWIGCANGEIRLFVGGW